MSFLKDSAWTFRGHGVALRGFMSNTILAITPINFILITLQMESTVGKIIYQILFILSLPHTAYLFCELKHLLLNDGIANDRDRKAILVFGGLSTLGLLLNIIGVQLGWALIPQFQNLGILGILLLSGLSAWGAALGLADLPLLAGIIFPPTILIASYKVIKSKLLWVALGLGVGLSILNMSIWYCIQLINSGI